MTLRLCVAILATYRLARLVAVDDFPPSEWLRRRVFVALGQKWGKGIDCPHCVGAWFALAVWAIPTTSPFWRWAVAPLAVAGGASVLSSAANRLDG